MAMLRKKAPPIDLEKFAVDTPISRAEAVQIIGQRTMEPRDDLRLAKNRASHRLGTAVKTHGICELPNGGFAFGDVTAWANRKKRWEGKFADLPMTPIPPNSAEAHLTLSGFGVEIAFSKPIPPGLVECQQECGRLNTLIAKLERDLLAATAEITLLRPIAERKRQHDEERRKNARKPRPRAK
jgi:hypothetical protein